MKFLVCEKQEGKGCDYTIGCGMRFGFIEADSIRDAIEQTIFPDRNDEYCTLEGEYALEKMLIIPAEYVISIDIAGMSKKIKQQKVHEAAEVQKEKELAEFNRLQAKYSS